MLFLDFVVRVKLTCADDPLTGSPDKAEQGGEANKQERRGTTVPLLLKGKERRPLSQLTPGVNTHKVTEQHYWLIGNCCLSQVQMSDSYFDITAVYDFLPCCLPAPPIAGFSFSRDFPFLSSIPPLCCGPAPSPLFWACPLLCVLNEILPRGWSILWNYSWKLLSLFNRYTSQN